MISADFCASTAVTSCEVETSKRNNNMVVDRSLKHGAELLSGVEHSKLTWFYLLSTLTTIS